MLSDARTAANSCHAGATAASHDSYLQKTHTSNGFVFNPYMAGRTRVAGLLSSWGLITLVGGLLLYDPSSYHPASVAGGLRWLAVLVATILGGGLVLSGIRVWQDGLEYARRMRLPALILAVIGLVVVIGSVPIFRPWAYSGLAGGLRGMGVLVFLVGGGLGVAVGIRYYQRRSPRLPLLCLAGVTGVGAFYRLDEGPGLAGIHHFLWVSLVILIVGGPIIAVFYGWHRLLETEPEANE